MAPHTDAKAPVAPEEVEYYVVDQGDDLLWSQFAHLVKAENWTSDDNSVLGLTPTAPSTRAVFARRKIDDNFLGCVVWNEYDGIAWIGFYLMHPIARGLGIGSVLWNRALGRIPKDHAIGLRAVPDMAAKYKEHWVPYEVGSLTRYQFTCNQLAMVCAALCTASEYKLKRITELSSDEFGKYLEFDQQVTKRERSAFLSQFHKVPLTDGVALFGADGSVIGQGAVTSSSFEERKLFKLSPVYASSIKEAAAIIQHLANYCQGVSPDSIIHIHFLSESAGGELLTTILEHLPDLKPSLPLRTLFSKDWKNPMDMTRVFVPHNNSCHYDA